MELTRSQVNDIHSSAIIEENKTWALPIGAVQQPRFARQQRTAREHSPAKGLLDNMLLVPREYVPPGLKLVRKERVAGPVPGADLPALANALTQS